MEFKLDASPATVCRALRRNQPNTVFLDGSGGGQGSWLDGPLVALEPEIWLQTRETPGSGASEALQALGRLVASRTAPGGSPDTGVVALLAYDLLDSDSRLAPRDHALPQLVVLTVDGSLRFRSPGTALLTVGPAAGAPQKRAERVERLRNLVAQCDREPSPPPARSVGRPRTSMPRDTYLRSIERVQRHIAAGDIYQANLCQRFRVPFQGDVFAAYENLSRGWPAPHSAFVETSDFALASLSPETFLRSRAPAEIETWPIKGTRPRGSSPAADRAASAELLRSEKDRAELLMIVDLERNDLSRVCQAGTVEVTELAGLRSFPAVHHLVACVRGRLRHDTDVAAILRATFPGGSISGAPKIRAQQILRELEPARRGFFTGSLLWFGDDGRLDSSILIRSWLFGDGQAFLGAGGGIVADSEPEQEWQESNHKARALAAGLGFDPEEAV
jgi:anthranilate/para-aminobenzoate synthase component I